MSLVHVRVTLFLAILLGVLYDVFLNPKGIGIGFTLFMTASLILFTVFAFQAKKVRNTWAVFLGSASFLSALSPALYALPNHHWIAVLSSVLFFALYIFWLTADPLPFKHARLFISDRILKVFWRGVEQGNEAFLSLRKEKKFSMHATNKIFLGVAVALPFLIIFIVLFAEADAIFEQYLEYFFELFGENFGETIWRFARTIILALLLFVIFYRLLSKTHDGSFTPRERTSPPDSIVPTTLFTLLNALFLFFVVIQFFYLFGGETFFREQDVGFTYSAYARSGFLELIAVSGLVIVISFLFGHWQHQFHQPRFLKFLRFLFIFQTYVILISAALRLKLYIDAYGLSLTRWNASLVILFIAFVLLIQLISIIRGKTQHFFLHWGERLGIVSVVIFLLINHAGVIASHNIDRYLRGQKENFDLRYLIFLSEDILPHIQKLKASLDERLKQRLYCDTRPFLYLYSAGYVDAGDKYPWQVYSLSVFRAERILNQLEEERKEFMKDRPQPQC